MYKNIGNVFILNGRITENTKFKDEFNSSNIIYEIIRVINNRVISFEGHMERLESSLEAFNVDKSIVEAIKKDVCLLIDYHCNLNKNIKIDVYDNQGRYDYRLYFVESVYPKQEYYELGVRTTSSNIIRTNPHIKLLDMSYKNKIQVLKGKDFFEVLLVNSDGYITEGSRANAVFVKENTLYITPLEEILVGITLRSVIKYAANLGYEIIYQSVHIDEISNYDACFLTGTSLGVLAISSIDEIKFNSSQNILVLSLARAYNGDVGY